MTAVMTAVMTIMVDGGSDEGSDDDNNSNHTDSYNNKPPGGTPTFGECPVRNLHRWAIRIALFDGYHGFSMVALPQM